MPSFPAGRSLLSAVLLLISTLSQILPAKPAATPARKKPAIGSQFLSLPSVPPALLSSLHWRSIGPYRGGRTRAVAGVPSQPNVFYIGVCNGGVWKTNDYGRTWQPIFDDQPTGSIGAIAVAPSDPNVVYVGSGEGLHRPDLSVGDGIYRSNDAGKTWTHLGLRDGQQIPQLAVDPRDPNKVFAAVAGHPYGPNKERGIFRSTDGGQSWQKVLPKSSEGPGGTNQSSSASGAAEDENVGGDDVLIDPSNPQIVYATLWEAREGPWENGAWNGTGGGIFKSTDGGQTFQQLTGGLPKDIIQSHIAIAESNPNRLMASVAAKPNSVWHLSLGRCRRDLGRRSPLIARPAGRIGGGDLSVPRFDPKDPDMVIRDQHGHVEIDRWRQDLDRLPRRSRRRRLPESVDQSQRSANDHYRASDQGAIVTVNGGETLEFLVQPADRADVSRECRQCFSLSRCAAASRRAARRAFPAAAMTARSPCASGIRCRRKNTATWCLIRSIPTLFMAASSRVMTAAPPRRRTSCPSRFAAQDFRVVRTEPIVFSPIDPHIFISPPTRCGRRMNGGQSWQQISPDLTRNDV